METLYAILLPIHSILRWVVILLALFVIVRAITGLRFRRPYEPMDDKAGLWYTLAFDVQVLVGLILNFILSPVTAPLWQNMGAGMSNAAARYFGVEHAVLMIVALALAHIGRSRAKKAAYRLEKERDKLTDRKEIARRSAQIHRGALIFFALSLVVTLAAIPWPFLAVGRRLFPGL